MPSIPNNHSNSTTPTPPTSTQSNEASTSSSSSNIVQNFNVNIGRENVLTETGTSTSSGARNTASARTSSARGDHEVPSTSTSRYLDLVSKTPEVATPTNKSQYFDAFSKNTHISTAGRSLPFNQVSEAPRLTYSDWKKAALLKRKGVDHTISRPLHLPLPAHNSVSANLPLPPNLHEHMEDVSNSLAAYKLFPISSMTWEFQKLARLLDPLSVNCIDRIVNPTVWTNFVNAREALLKAKCDDLTVLSQLGLNDEEIAKRRQSVNFMRHNAIDAAAYNENFFLLFHCTKDNENIERILRDGFDERMARGGFLGRGIYFSDDAQKSSTYDRCGGVIFICGVLLGDCFTDYLCRWTGLGYLRNDYLIGLTREPEKLPVERRNINDNFFDSVHGASTSNEYAVYNRYQCCPLYRVTYSKKSTMPVRTLGGCTRSMYDTVNRPPFGWIPDKSSNESSTNINFTWILHAKAIFDEIATMHAIESVDPSTPMSIDEMLAFLMSLGFGDTKLNLKTLLLNDFSIERTVDVLSQRRITVKLRNKATVPEKESEKESKNDSELSSLSASSDEIEQPPRARRRLSKTETPEKSSSPTAIEEECFDSIR